MKYAAKIILAIIGLYLICFVSFMEGQAQLKDHTIVKKWDGNTYIIGPYFGKCFIEKSETINKNGEHASSYYCAGDSHE